MPPAYWQSYFGESMPACWQSYFDVSMPIDACTLTIYSHQITCPDDYQAEIHWAPFSRHLPALLAHSLVGVGVFIAVNFIKKAEKSDLFTHIYPYPSGLLPKKSYNWLLRCLWNNKHEGNDYNNWLLPSYNITQQRTNHMHNSWEIPFVVVNVAQEYHFLTT